MSNEYPPSGALFNNQNKERDTQPDMTGRLELSADVVADLNSQLKAGNSKPVISLASWKKTSKSGMSYLSVRGASLQKQSEKSNTPDDQIPF
tara:strand:+ start:25 stop:300 length:276 start_codon:yes stop_codon:yes gene_type:complete